MIDDSIDQMLINECQQAVVQELENCIAEENGNEDTTQKFSLKIFVPTLDAYKYKSQVVSELASRGNISADRLIGVQSSNDSEQTNTTNSERDMVGLFDYVAISSDSDDEFYIAQVEQIFGQYTAQNGRKRRVEYVRPFDIKINNVQVNFKVIYFERKSELELERTDIHSEVPCSNVLQKVTVTYQQDAQLYCLSAINKLFLDAYFSRRMGQNNLADDGRQVTLMYSSRGQQRRSV